MLPGDSLVEQFDKTAIDGEIIVCRECLIDGDLAADKLWEFWQVREKYLTTAYGGSEKQYHEIKQEFVKLRHLADGNAVNLWFEYELFCQVNLWFCLWLLRNTRVEFYVVYPKLKNKEDVWKGFSLLNTDQLKESFAQKVRLGHDDIYLGVQLWQAFQQRDFERLKELGKTESKCFPTLKEVCQAAAEIDTRPKESIRKIIAEGNENFNSVFGAFNKNEAIYGFGDLQVKKIYDKIVGE